MMDCREMSALVSRSVDGELDAAEEKVLREHLAGCASCAEMERRERAIGAAMSARRAALPPAAVEAAVGAFRERMRHEKELRVQRLFRWAALAATVLLTLGIVAQAVTIRAARKEARSLAMELAAVRAAARQTSGAAQDAAALINPTETAVAEQVQAFRATYDYLNGTLRWMVSDGSEVQLGMSGGGVARAETTRRQALVLNFQYVEHNKGGESKVLSKPEFVMMSGEEVSVRLRGESAGEPLFRYRVRAERLIDGQVRAQVSFANEDFASAEVNTKLNADVQLVPGRPVLVGASGDSTRRWELYLWGAARPAFDGRAARDGGPS